MLGEAYPSDTAINENYCQTPARASQPDNLTFHFPCSARLTRPTRRLPKPTSARASQPDNIFSVSSHHHSNPAERYTLDHQTTLAFSPPPVRFSLMSEVVRASRLDNLTFSSYVSEANPSNRRARPPVGCRLSIPTILYLSVFTCPTQ